MVGEEQDAQRRRQTDGARAQQREPAQRGADQFLIDLAAAAASASADSSAPAKLNARTAHSESTSPREANTCPRPAVTVASAVIVKVSRVATQMCSIPAQTATKAMAEPTMVTTRMPTQRWRAEPWLVDDDDEQRCDRGGEAELAEDHHDRDDDEDGPGTGEPATHVDLVHVEREGLSQSVVHVDSVERATVGGVFRSNGPSWKDQAQATPARSLGATAIGSAGLWLLYDEGMAWHRQVEQLAA